MRHLRALSLLVIAAALTQVHSAYLLELAITVALQSLPAIGLTLLLGYARQISVGHAAFYGLGAYGSALLSQRLGVPPLLSLPLAVAGTGGLAWLLGRPILRLHGHYLAMGTLAFGSIVSIVLVEWRGLTGGSTGLSDIPPLSIVGLDFTNPEVFAPVAWVVLAVAAAMVLNLVDSPAGLLMRGLGDSERAVAALATDTRRLKAQVFTLSAMLAALGGGLYAHYIGFISPQPFSVSFSVRLLVVVAIGGMRNVMGVIAGVAFVTVVSEPLQDLGYWDVPVLGLLLVGVVVLCPEGLPAAIVRLWPCWRKAA